MTSLLFIFLAGTTAQLCSDACAQEFISGCFAHFKSFAKCFKELEDGIGPLAAFCVPGCIATDEMTILAVDGVLQEESELEPSVPAGDCEENGERPTPQPDTWQRAPDPNVTCDLPRIDASDMSADELAEMVLAAGAPVLIVNALGDAWRALETWQDKTTFTAAQGHRQVPVVSSPAHVAQFGGEPPETAQGLDVNFALSDVDAPLAFAFGYKSSEDISPELGPSKLDAFEHTRKVLSVGGQGSGLTLHQHGPAWLAVIIGHKRWSLVPPEAMPKETYRSVALQRVHKWAARDRASLKSAGSLECMQQAGEVVYVPLFWWHATSNLDECIAVGAQMDEFPISRAYLDCSPFVHMIATGAVDSHERLSYFEKAVRLQPLNVMFLHALAYELMDRSATSIPNATRLVLQLISKQISMFERLWEEERVSGADAAPLLVAHSMGFLNAHEFLPPSHKVWSKGPHRLDAAAFQGWQRHVLEVESLAQRVDSIYQRFCAHERCKV